jgi:hypothetical protein
MANDGRIGESIIVNNNWEDGHVYSQYDWLAEGTRLYVCNTAGVQRVSFASNLAKWDIIPLGDSDKLVVASDGTSETAEVGTEYVSPEQQGGIYGTIYRQYFGVKLTTEVVAAVGVDAILDYGIYDDTAKNFYRGLHDDGTDTMKLAVGTDEMVFTIVNLVCTKGWVDYTKA